MRTIPSARECAKPGIVKLQKASSTGASNDNQGKDHAAARHMVLGSRQGALPL
jgi:hypothetical protein